MHATDDAATLDAGEHEHDDAATLDAGEHDIWTHTAGEASDTGEHAAKSIADATRAHSARTHAARVRDAGECDAALAVDMPRITRALTHSVESSPFTYSGEQVQVQERESAKAPPHSTYRSRTTNSSSTAETSLQRLSNSILSRESLR